MSIEVRQIEAPDPEQLATTLFEAPDPRRGRGIRLRAHVPDGCGVFQRGRFPREGETVVLDDDLILYPIKPLSGEHSVC